MQILQADKAKRKEEGVSASMIYMPKDSSFSSVLKRGSTHVEVSQKRTVLEQRLRARA